MAIPTRPARPADLPGFETDIDRDDAKTIHSSLTIPVLPPSYRSPKALYHLATAKGKENESIWNASRWALEHDGYDDASSQAEGSGMSSPMSEKCSSSVVHIHTTHADDDDGKVPTHTPTAKQPNPFKKPLRFWLIFASLMVVTCLTAIDMTIMSTTLPTIVRDLPSSTISGAWVTSSFLLTTTAFQPFMGGLSDVVGRRAALTLAVILFVGGSIICAEARSILALVIGRGIQGMGGGGVQTIAEIVLSDITTLRERGIFVGLISLVFAVATFLAPVLGGLFSEHNWRWVFWINVPIGIVSLAVILPTMKLNVPQMPLRKKIHRMDIPANLFLLLPSVVAIMIALTNGGIVHPWSSWRIWLPFSMGWLGFMAFFAIEMTDNQIAPDPVLPRRLFANRTVVSCFLMTFVHGLLTYGLIYLMPIYFQAIKSSSPLRSAVQLFPATAPGPFSAILAGALMARTGTYRVQLWIWWSLTMAGCGILCLLSVDTPTAQWVLFQLVPGFGVGALFTLTLPPIQASLPVKELAHATASFNFFRSLGSVWGISIATNVFVSIVNDQLKDIPGLAQAGLTGATALAFTTELQTLPIAVQANVRDAYMTGIRTSLFVFCPVALVGLVISAFVKEVPLPDYNDSDFGLEGSNITSNSKQVQGGRMCVKGATVFDNTFDSPFNSPAPSSVDSAHFDKHSFVVMHEKSSAAAAVGRGDETKSSQHLRNRSIHLRPLMQPQQETRTMIDGSQTRYAPSNALRQAHQNGSAL